MTMMNECMYAYQCRIIIDILTILKQGPFNTKIPTFEIFVDELIFWLKVCFSLGPKKISPWSPLFVSNPSQKRIVCLYMNAYRCM